MNNSDELNGVDRLVEEFTTRQQRGENPSVEEYCQRHPKLADEIRDVLEALMMVEELKPSSIDESGTLGASVQVDGQRLDQVGDYRILCEIGRGGMGVVYEAEQLSLGRRVALKVLPRQLAGDGKSLARFQREAKAAARMHHTNIVPVFEVGNDNEHVFYAMQLIQGQGLDLVIDDLTRLRHDSATSRVVSAPGSSDRRTRQPEHSIAQSLVSGGFQREQLGGAVEAESSREGQGRNQVPETIALQSGSTASARLPGKSDISTAERDRGSYFISVAQIGQQTASALSYAHARGIVHRDIKPSNLLLDAAGVVWVTDFGLAKTGDHGLTHTGDMLGTIRYMSPERFSGRCDVRADVYSLGLTLYELLLLQPAFSSSDQLKLIDQINKSEAAAPRSIDPRIPRDLETIVLKSIEKDPKRRYQSADELADDLERFIQDEPIKARRVSMVERASRWSRRNKALAATFSVAGTLLLVIAIGAAAAAGYYRRMEQQASATALEKAQLADEMSNLAESNRTLAEDNVREAARASASEQAALAAKETAIAAEQARRRELYLAEMHEVRQAYDEGARNRIDYLLKKYVPGEGEIDLRGWEWYYWWRTFHRHHQQVYHNPLYDLAVAPDKSWIAALVWNSELLILDAQTLQVITRLPTGRSDHGMRQALAVSPDGRFLAALTNSQLDLWQTDDWSRHTLLSEDHNHWALGFSPDGRLAAGDENGRITFWDAERREQLGPSLETHQSLRCFAFSPDGTRLATGSWGTGPTDPSTLLVWDVASGDLESNLFERAPQVLSIDWTMAGEESILAAGVTDGNVYLFDGQSYTHRDQLHAGAPVLDVRFSDDGGTIAAATSQQHAVHVWETASSRPLGSVKGHAQSVWGVEFADSGSKIWTAGGDGWLKSWNISKCDCFARLPPTASRITSHEHPYVRFDSDGQTVWRVESTGDIDRMDIHGQSHDRISTFSEDRYPALSRDGRFMAAFKEESDLEVRFQMWESDGSEFVLLRDRLIPTKEIGAVPRRVVISDDGSVVSWSHESLLFRYVVDSGRLTPWSETDAGSIAVSPDGKLLAVVQGSTSWRIRLWDIDSESPQLIKSLPNGDPIYRMRFSRDQSLLAVAYWDGLIGLLDTGQGGFVGTLHGHAGPVHDVDFSPSGSLLASGGADGAVRIWEIANRTLRLSLPPHDLPIMALEFSHDGQHIASASEDGELRIWQGGTQSVAGDIDHRLWIAEVHATRGDTQLAIAQLGEAIRLTPDNNARTRIRRGDLYRTVEDYPRALADYRAALHSDDPELRARATNKISTLLSLLATWQPMSQQIRWRYTVAQPAGDWRKIDFDDSAWTAGGGPRFHTSVFNLWPQRQIWLRGEIQIDQPPANPPGLLAYVDDEVRIFINGDEAATARWAGTDYQILPSKVKFESGRNVIAVHCIDNSDEYGGVHVVPGTTPSPEQSLQHLSDTLEFQPDSLPALEQRAALYSGLQRWDEAAADYVTLLRIRSQQPDWSDSPVHSSRRSRFLQPLNGDENLFAALQRQLPDAADLWVARARSLATQSKWGAAADAYAAYGENPPLEYEVQFEQACAMLLSEDELAYRALVSRITREFGDDPTPGVGFVLARTAGLAPQESAWAQRAVAWAERGISDDTRPWTIHALGLAQFRAGNYDAAKEHLTDALNADWSIAQNQVALALVCHATGDQDGARALFNEARSWRDDQVSAATNSIVNVQAIDWIALHALLREAEAVIDNP